MPLYEYECSSCHHRFEKIESFSASEKKQCPKCGKIAKRVLAAPAIQFKGSGWYVTDYARKGSNTAPTAAASAEKTSTTSTEKGTSEKASADKKD